jgi:deoxyribonuclease IV
VLTSPLGAHIKVGGGLARTGLARIGHLGATAAQVFVGNPRGWAQPAGDRDQDRAFRAGCEEQDVAVYVHTPYLVNLGSPTAKTVELSTSAVAYSRRRGAEIGARGVVVHTGSAVDTGDRDAALRQVRETLLPLLDDDGPDVLLEPTAGLGGNLCGRVEELEPYLAALDHHPRLGVCLDTCHALAAGHDLATPGGMTETLDALVRIAGPGRLRLVHANDSKDPVGSCRDRHEAIGEGTIGLGAFAELLAHHATRGVPVILETPEELADHREQLDRLRHLPTAEDLPPG